MVCAHPKAARSYRQAVKDPAVVVAPGQSGGMCHAVSVHQQVIAADVGGQDVKELEA